MIVGLILVASMLGAVAAMAALILGQPIWLALLIYSGTGVAVVLAGATALALRPDAARHTAPGPCTLSRASRG